MLSPYLLLVLATLFWGGNFTAGKSLVSFMPPVTMSEIRWFVSIWLFLPFALKEWKETRAILHRHRMTLLFMAITGIAGFNALTYLSMQYTSSINASLMNAFVPVLVALLSFLFLKERIGPFQILGTAFSLFGVLWILTSGHLERLLALSFNKGDLIMLSAVFSWAVYSLIVKRSGTAIPLKSSFQVTMIIGWLILLPFAVWELATWEKAIRLEPVHCLQLAYISTLPSVVAFMCWNKAVLAVGPAKAAVFLNLIVVFTTLFSILFLGERLSSAQLIGGLLVIGGVYLSTQMRAKKLPAERDSRTSG